MMPLNWNELSLLAIAAVFTIFIFGLLIFLNRLKRTLDRLDEAISSGKGAVDAAAGELRTALVRLAELETGTSRTLEQVVSLMAALETEVIPLLRSMHGTAEVYGRLGVSLTERLERDVTPILENARAITEDAGRLAADIRSKVAQTEDFFEAAREGAETVRAVTRIARHGATGLAVQIAAMAVGAKSSLEFLSNHLTSKGGDRK